MILGRRSKAEHMGRGNSIKQAWYDDESRVGTWNEEVIHVTAH